MTRRLSSDERRLWDLLRRSIRPLRSLAVKAEDDSAAAVGGLLAAGKEHRHFAPPLPPKPAVPSEPPLVALDSRARRRLTRGLAEVDARLDLHGMRQERAFAALFAFLRNAQAHGARVVLVITGKGKEGEEGRGVLRHAVPAWMARPEFRELVVGFEEASRRHGGAGALYVRLRRRRSDRGVAGS